MTWSCKTTWLKDWVIWAGVPQRKHHIARFGGHRHFGIEDVMVLVCSVILPDLVIKKSCGFIGSLVIWGNLRKRCSFFYCIVSCICLLLTFFTKKVPSQIFDRSINTHQMFARLLLFPERKFLNLYLICIKKAKKTELFLCYKNLIQFWFVKKNWSILLF